MCVRVCVRACVRACVSACGCVCAGTFRALTLASASVRTMKWPDSPTRPRRSQITRECAHGCWRVNERDSKRTLRVLRGTHGVRISGVGVSTRSGWGKKGIDRWLTRDAWERRHRGLRAVCKGRRRSGATMRESGRPPWPCERTEGIGANGTHNHTNSTKNSTNIEGLGAMPSIMILTIAKTRPAQ